MMRYFFDIDGNHPHADLDGIQLDNDLDAWKEALRTTRDLEDKFCPNDTWRLEVRREDTMLYVITVSSRRIG